MKLLIAIAALGLLTSAQSLDRNIVTLIPSTNPSTGAPVTPGQLLMRDIVEPARTVGITGPAAVTQLVVVSATAASPMVLTLNALAPAWAVLGATITLSGATGSGCSGMNATLPVFSSTGSTVTVTYNNTGCTYGASSASMLTHFLWVWMPGDAIGPVCSDGHQNLTVNPSCTGGGGGLPVLDSTIITQGAADPTKQMRFSNTGITTGNTRVLSIQDFNYTLAGIDHTETFTADQTFHANILSATGAENIGSGASFFNQAFIQDVITDELIIDTGSTAKFHVGYDAVTGGLAVVNIIAQVLWEFNASPGATTYGPIYPSSTASFDLGAPGAYFNNAYLTGLYVSGNVFTSLVPSGSINIGSSGSFWPNAFIQDVITDEVIFDNGSTAEFHMGYDAVTGGLAVVNSISQVLWEFNASPGATSYGPIYPSATNTFNLGSSSFEWATLYLGTALGGTYNLSGNETVTGNWYNRTFSGAPSCSGVANGWQGVDTSGLNLDLCVSSTLYSVPLVSSGAWTVYTPSGTNLSSPTWDAAYQCVGKTCSVRIGVAATATSTGTIAVSLPTTPYDTNQAPSCFVITSGTYASQPCVIVGSTIVSEGNWMGSSTHTWIFSMVYQTT